MELLELSTVFAQMLHKLLLKSVPKKARIWLERDVNALARRQSHAEDHNEGLNYHERDENRRDTTTVLHKRLTRMSRERNG